VTLATALAPASASTRDGPTRRADQSTPATVMPRDQAWAALSVMATGSTTARDSGNSGVTSQVTARDSGNSGDAVVLTTDKDKDQGAAFEASTPA
jgi:hypothetical protein